MRCIHKPCLDSLCGDACYKKEYFKINEKKFKKYMKENLPEIMKIKPDRTATFDMQKVLDERRISKRAVVPNHRKEIIVCIPPCVNTIYELAVFIRYIKPRIDNYIKHTSNNRPKKYKHMPIDDYLELGKENPRNLIQVNGIASNFLTKQGSENIAFATYLEENHLSGMFSVNYDFE
jgi:hypothetical protein